MELPMPNSYQRHSDYSNGDPRTSSPASRPSTQAMIPPSNPYGLAPARAPVLVAPLPPHQIGSRSPGGYNTSYNAPYGSASPSTASGSIHDSQSNDHPSLTSAGISPTQISSQNLNTQKRVYRQRRKDPSCDACRERKVKCDATETSSCSECSSRHTKCQFTKETNRRMSSIKQVQDLQSQLADAKHEITQLRSMLPDPNAMDIDRATSDRERSIASSPTQKMAPPILNDFDHVRRNIHIYSRDIFRPPPLYRQTGVPSALTTSFPELPPKAAFELHFRYYHEWLHDSFPVIHWPTFQHEVDQVYASRSFLGTSQAWAALFFAVMACGSLQAKSAARPSGQDPVSGTACFETSVHCLTPLPDELEIAHAQAALLLSIFATESNQRTVGSGWLASAVRIAQDLGLNTESARLPVVEAETRRRLWWSIYSWDRILSLEMGRPMLIHDDDCDVTLPAPVDDHNIQPHGIARNSVSQTPYIGLATAIPVVRCLPQLQKSLRASCVPHPVIGGFEERFHQLLNFSPEHHRPDSEDYLDPAILPSLFLLQIACLHLYRHNLSPVCPAIDRTDALRRCTRVARDTARYISRTMRTPGNHMELDKSWESNITQRVSSLVCLHLWRCMLVLCFSADYDAALTCLRFSRAIKDLRKVNIACGKNLLFFLERLKERLSNGDGGHHLLETDEEILAYLSGDMQGHIEHAWVWTGPDAAPPRSGTSISSPGSDRPVKEEGLAGGLPVRPGTASRDNESKQWEGWDRIETIMRQLEMEQRVRLAQPPSYYPPPHNPMKRIQLASDRPGSASSSTPTVPSPSTSAPPTGASRISIANII